MKVIIGLGNPEEKYRGTRHNVGFWALEALSGAWNTSFKLETKFNARIATVNVDGEKVLLVQPQTYYNDVGISARALLDFYKLTTKDFLIIHDDLALPLGTIRTRFAGSDGGNNGLKSLAAHIGTDTARMRVGVWVEHHHGADKVGIVLGKFNRDEQNILTGELSTIRQITQDFIAGNFEITTHKS